jgi:hemerythrin-like domain-containing protein
MVRSSSSRTARPLGALLRFDHERLEASFLDLVDEFHEGDRDDLRAAWARFERGLLAHFDAEERYLLPLFARVDPGEAAALVAEHDLFRREVAELGVGVDLHVVRLDAARELVDGLREHAAREERLFYRWAEAHVDRARRLLVERGLTRARGRP